MANQTGDIYTHGTSDDGYRAGYRERKNVIKKDKYYRFQIVGQANGILGDIWIPKSLSMSNSNTITLTIKDGY